MKESSDARFAFLRDPDLYDLVGRLALKRVRDEALADDIRQGGYVVAMHLVLEGKGPEPGAGRGWMCRVARNHTFEVLRAINEQEQPLETGEEPDIPVEDQTTLHAQQVEVERRLDIVAQIAAKHRPHVRVALRPDGRIRKGVSEAQDDAARKRKQRSRVILASAFSAALAAVIAVLVMRGPGAPAPALPAGGYASLADAQHELAAASCGAKQWPQCLDDLGRLQRLDPSKMGPREHAARDAAVAGMRQEALAACAKGDYMTCIEGLDAARRYDPAGESDPRVKLARSEAAARLGGGAAPLSVPDAKEVPPR